MSRSAKQRFYDCVWRRGVMQAGSAMFLGLLLLQTLRFGPHWGHVGVAFGCGWIGGLCYGWYLYWRSERGQTP